MGFRIIAIIPARGGSKGIPKKNIRLMAGKPLIAYTIESALKSTYINNVVVSTDDIGIAEISKLYNANVIMRPDYLAQDDVPLDPVIYHALKKIEESENIIYDFIVTIQPTSPLLKSETINKAIEHFIKGNYDTLISVKAEPHLHWMKENGSFIPLYKERKNRQYLDPIYKETGSILICNRDTISETNRIGDSLYLFEIPANEVIDIDTFQDWIIAENHFNRKKIVFRVDGTSEIGLGHIYRTITIANRLIENNDIVFLMDENKKLGIQKVLSSNFPVISFENEKNLIEKLEIINPDIVINDILDTESEYIMQLKKMGYFVVNFEDMSEGSEVADVVINSLYELSNPPKNHYYGYQYECLRDEFFIYPKKQIQASVQRILVTFGGTDPNDLTMRSLKAIHNLKLKDISINVILGLGYGHKKELYSYVNHLLKEGFVINVKENIEMMSHEIYNADIVLTSNGRTVYEIASIGTPFISISQNERESRHLFVNYLKNNMYLGIAYVVSEDDIASSLKRFIENEAIRTKINESLLRLNFKAGMDRIIRLIFEKYQECKGNEKYYA